MIELLSVVTGIAFFLVSLVLFAQTYRLASYPSLTKWWVVLAALILSFLAGYGIFISFLINGRTLGFDLNRLISLIFLLGSVFVLVCAWLFYATLRERLRVDEELSNTRDQLLQAQKLEAIGRLAGSVAHDFNNVLTVINGYAELAANALVASDPLRKCLEEIRKAGDRAESLTRQLLAFSRNQVSQKQPLHLSDVVLGLEDFVGQLIRNDVQIVIEPLVPGRIMADANQLEQVIMNLVINARDAMVDGGVITIRIDDADSSPGKGVEQSFVELSVADTGLGMSEETLARIFEPFFTTKDEGMGTGLGLSTVYGIVQQHGGQIMVESAIGKGTLFRVLLPRLTSSATPLSIGIGVQLPPPDAVVGQSTILLVEDEAQVLRLVARILEEGGYRVIQARSGAEALFLSEQHHDTLHLILTDVLLPYMNGPELAERLRRQRPHIPTLFMSGYPADSERLDSILAKGATFIHKPFKSTDLLRAVVEALGQKAAIQRKVRE